LQSRYRLKFVFLCFIIVWIFIVYKLFKIQILDHDDIVSFANLQYKRQKILPAERGLIFDRNKEKLAFNELNYNIYLEEKFYQELSNNQKADLLSKISSYAKRNKNSLKRYVESSLKKGRRSVLVAKNLEESEWAELKDRSYKTLRAESFNHRVYGKVAHNLIGYVNSDNVGTSGLEVQFQDYLKGKDGIQILQKDANNKLFTNLDYKLQEAVHGKHVVLTIDQFHQDILESELGTAIETYKAKAASGIIMHPNTGEIYAIASLPSYDSNDPSKIKSGKKSEYIRANRALLDVFHPGSTFKIVTAAVALEESYAKLTDIIDCENGRYKYGPKVYTDGNHKYSRITFREVIEKSSNIGTIKVSQNFDQATFYRYIRDFGFGKKTDVMIDGEAEGILSAPENWSKLSMPSISIGYEISVTAIQLAQAYAAIANGGLLTKPVLVKEELDQNYELIKSYKTETIRRVISNKTAKTLSELLKAVVESGTATQAKSKYVSIAGKTGTAEIYDPIKKSWTTGANTAIFSGFFPVEKPSYVMVIVINEPRYKHLNFGGWTAAPTFKRIAEKLIGTVKSDEPWESEVMTDLDSNSVYIPDLIGMRVKEANEFLKQKKITVKIVNNGGYVIEHKPPEGLHNKSTVSTVYLITDDEKSSVMPDLKGLTVREALRRLKRFRVELVIEGSGKVYAQSVKKGDIVKENEEIIIKCRD
jgi:cell division protein FtsI/penicillin-binding protein 2